MPVVSLVVMLGQIKYKSISLGMAPLLGLSCTFLACVFDRPGWKLYSKPCHGPLVGLCWVTWWLCWAYVRPMLSKKMPPFGLMFSQFQPRPKKNQVWVEENRPFPGHAPAILGLSCAKLGVCWAYLAAIGTSTAWATRRNFTLYKVKFDMTHFLA